MLYNASFLFFLSDQYVLKIYKQTRTVLSDQQNIKPTKITDHIYSDRL